MPRASDGHIPREFRGTNTSQFLSSTLLAALFAFWRIHAREENRENCEKTDKERIPYRRNPRPGNQEEDIGVAQREGPAHRGPKRRVISDVPDGESPEKDRSTRTRSRNGEEGDTQQHK